MSKTVLLLYAQPEPTSLTRQLVEVSAETLLGQGHKILRSDLYGMKFKAVYDAEDFPDRLDQNRLSFVAESGHAFAQHTQPADIAAEQAKLREADAVILQFPLWWFGVPAILKGWFERVFAYGFAYGFGDGSNRTRYGEGGLKGKRALVNVLTGGPAADYGPRGVNGPIDDILFPLLHGTLFYPGMAVLPAHPVFGAGRVTTQAQVDDIKALWRARVERLFVDEPIKFRTQNGGDFPDRHTLAEDVATGKTGFAALIGD